MTTEERVTSLEQQVATVAAKVDMLVTEAQQQREDLRRLNEKQAQDIREIRQKQESDMREIRSSISNMQNNIDGMGKHVRNMAITSMAAIGAMVITVIISLLRS